MARTHIREIRADGSLTRRGITRSQRTVVLALATAAIVIAANASQGAYFSQSWGWVALAFLVPTTVLLLLERAALPGRLRVALVALFGAYAGWIALSALWSISTPATMREVERVLVYVALALAAALVLRRGDVTGVLAGIAVGTTGIASYALATRTFPDRFHSYDDPLASYRLAQPLGYWNALGLLAVLGTVVALGFVAHARRTPTSIVAALFLPILATTLYFTFSRGAWGALAVGLLATVVLDPRRLRYLWTGALVAIPVALCLAYASRQDALTTEGSRAADAAREGHRMAGILAAAILGSAVAAWIARAVARRVSVSRRAARGANLGLAAAAVAVVVGVLVVAGGPGAVYSGLKSRFDAETVQDSRLNDRLFTISSNGRVSQFRVAWHAGQAHPVAGSGSGTFEYIWYERRPNLLVVRDAHSLYLEAFAEVGVIGLALLVSALVVLIAGGARARRTRFAASGTAAAITWAVAAGIDWHWEMVGVTLTALLAGAAALVASERRTHGALGGTARGLLAALAVALSVAATVSLVGNQALFAAKTEVDRKEWQAARRDGRRAHALLPWSIEPELALGDAAAGAGDREGALEAYREAVTRDPSNWVAWLRLAQVERGAERARAYARVHRLNPREENLPGE